MNDKQIAALREKIKKVIESKKGDWMVASESGAITQHSANLNGTIKGLEFALGAIDDVIAND